MLSTPAVIVVCLRTRNLQRLLHRAEVLGLVTPDYVYLYYQLLPSHFTQRPWGGDSVLTGLGTNTRGDSQLDANSSATNPFRYLKQVNGFGRLVSPETHSKFTCISPTPSGIVN